jgi:hypothetical protein
LIRFCILKNIRLFFWRKIHYYFLGTSAEEGVGICHSVCEFLMGIKVGFVLIYYTIKLIKITFLTPFTYLSWCGRSEKTPLWVTCTIQRKWWLFLLNHFACHEQSDWPKLIITIFIVALYIHSLKVTHVWPVIGFP